MKLTKQQLKQIIMEELEAALSEEGLDMSKLHKPTSLPGKSEEDDSEDLQEKTFAPGPPTKDYKGNVKAAQRRAADSVKMQDLKSRSSFADPAGERAGANVLGDLAKAGTISSPIVDQGAKWADDASDALVRTGGAVGGAVKGLRKYIPPLSLASTGASLKDTLTNPETSTAQKAGGLARAGADTAVDVASLAPTVMKRFAPRVAGALAGTAGSVAGAGIAGYEAGKAFMDSDLAHRLGAPDMGGPTGFTDVDFRPSAIKGAFTGGDHTGGTQVDLSTRTDASCKRRGPKGKCLDAPSPTTPKPTPSPTTPKPSDLVGKRDDEDDIPKPGKNLAEAWGFSMDLDKLNESTSGHVTPAKD